MTGSPYAGTDPYSPYTGPGGVSFYQPPQTGHPRYPYYSYRAPWYYPGHPVHNWTIGSGSGSVW